MSSPQPLSNCTKLCDKAAYSQPKAILTHGPTLLSVMTAQLGGDFWIKGLDKAIGYYGADAPLVPSDPLEK